MITQHEFEQILDSVRKNTIEKLHLNKRGLNGAQIVELSAALENNTSVISFSLDENYNCKGSNTALADADHNMPKVAAEAIGRMLQKNKTLKNVSLYEAWFSPESVIVIAEGMESNTTVLSMDLGYNRMGIIGARAMAKMLRKNHTLQTLGLSVNDIEQVGASEIAQALRVNLGLQNLNLNVNPIGAAGATALARVLEGDKVLKRLSLRGCNINSFQSQNNGFRGVMRSMGNMAYYGLGGFIMDQVNTLNRWFHLSCRNLSLDGVSALANMLKVNVALQELVLDDNDPWSNEAARNFADALKVNKTLKSLSMDRSGGRTRVGISALINSLEFNKTLENWNWWIFNGRNAGGKSDLPVGRDGVSKEELALVNAFFARGGNAKTANGGVLAYELPMVGADGSDSKDSQEQKVRSESMSSNGDATIEDPSKTLLTTDFDRQRSQSGRSGKDVVNTELRRRTEFHNKP